MSHSFIKRSGATSAAVAAGLVLLAAPAHAAQRTESAGDQAKTAASASEIAANNAAVWASLPLNVTMTVLGKMPTLQGPIDHYTQNGPTTTTGVTTLAVATLPYSFTFDGVQNKDGRTFKSTKKKICTDIEVTYDYPVDGGHSFKLTLSSTGGSATVPTDGVARSYCWSGVPTNTAMHFTYATTGNTGGFYAYASGSGQVRYP
ncbi:hypothetical protein [Actinoplanes sp. NPDC020271]|uniref:hypothetical protein n=1 Tax=Actinoplanes sp. NPDC020271 TaxID=3363896 RepID=UPI0037A6E131